MFNELLSGVSDCRAAGVENHLREEEESPSQPQIQFEIFSYFTEMNGKGFEVSEDTGFRQQMWFFCSV